MRNASAACRLSFILPDRVYRSVPRGPLVPCLHGTLLTVHGAGLVSVEGKPIETVLEQARRFLRSHRLTSVEATLLDPIDCAVGSAQRGVLLAGRTVTFSSLTQLQLPGFGTDAA